MKNYTQPELVKLALQLEDELATKRGYHSGIREEHIKDWDSESLIRCMKANIKRFNLTNVFK